MVDETPAESIRRSHLLRTLFTVLREAKGPIPAAEALRRVRERADLTPREDSLGPGGKHRANTFVSFGSSWATAVGWMTKDGGWALTPAGLAAIDEVGNDPHLDNRLNRMYRETLKAREGTDAANPRWELLVDALTALEPGHWTTYGDLGELIAMPAQAVGGYLQRNPVPNPYRVLQASGTVAPDFTWTDPQRHDDPRDLLAGEGVEFDDNGRASPAQRLWAQDLRELLGLEDDESAVAKRAWLIRGSSVNGKNLVPTWLAQGSCSLAASQLRALNLPVSKRELASLVEEVYAHVSYNARAEKLTELDTFINRMQPGDLVVTTSEGQVFAGQITGDASYVKSSDNRSNLRRDVDWLDAEPGIDFADLPRALQAKLSSQHSLQDLTSELATIERLISTTPDEVTEEPAAVELRDATDALAEQLLIDRAWIQELIELLRERGQVILYGPPGTGKTFLAQAIAEHLTERDAVKLVQFHPAYSYEDFFEGFRPAEAKDGSGSVGFTLSPGPFRRLVDAARENPSTAYVLIIDEINRANLAKVFGELYFLLEYRDKAIDLLYSGGDAAGFTLPPNVYLIGTMNTADRSIALVDAAMRRRFAFVALHPDDEPTAGLFGRWLAKNELPPTNAALLAELNRLIEDKDFKIGPSYLMRPEVYADGGLSRAWRTAILPLLEEHHYGDGIDVEDRYGLDRLLRRVAENEAPPTEPPAPNPTLSAAEGADGA